MHHQLRIVRPVSDLARTQAMYCQGLRLVGGFQDHAVFDGIMLGQHGATCH